jgi:CRISPR/Cas system-associated endonuclease Cas1
MHEGSNGSSKFIFDLMEPERPKVDRKVLDFVKSTAFDPADFVIRSDGVCRQSGNGTDGDGDHFGQMNLRLSVGI